MGHSEGVSGRALLTVIATAFLTFTMVFSQSVLAVNASGENTMTSTTAGVEAGAGHGRGTSLDARFYAEEAEKLSRFFTENNGQFGESVKFVADTEFGKAVFYESKVLYIMGGHQDSCQSGIDTIQMTFPGANVISPAGIGLKSHSNNYLFGEESNWIVNVRNYDSIVYRDLWTGIDLVYSFNSQGLKYEFTVSPFVPVDVVRVSVEGASLGMGVSALTFDTGRGHLTDGDLIVGYADSDERLSARFAVEENVYGFDVPGRDVARGVVIDPLVSSTYVGGSGDEYGFSIALDTAGDVYVTGSTNSTDFPLAGAYQGANSGGYDVFVFKLNSAGTSLLYSTYIGGTGNDYSHAIALDSSRNAYVTGRTHSPNFPVVSAFQGSMLGPNDVFLFKLSAAGSALVYSTFIGGNGGDLGYSIFVDSTSSVYLTGYTSSANFPLANANQTTNAGGYDVFVLKMNADGSELVYSTYVGGDDEDEGHSIVADSTGNAYVTGSTNSSNFPLAGAIQTTKGVDEDVFVFKIGSAGDTILYSTYVGGDGDDGGESIAIDANGNAYVTGFTTSTDFPLANAYQDTYGGGSFDAFLFKIDSSGSTFLYSTFLGGNGDDGSYCVTVDLVDEVYVTGHTFSSNFPVVNAFQSTNAGEYDVFLVKFNSTGTGLMYSTYIGGSGWDQGISIVIDTGGNARMTGQTTSSDFPLAGAYQGTYGGGPHDAFVVRFDFSSVPSAPQNLEAARGNEQVTLTWDAPVSDGELDITTYIVYRGTSSGTESHLMTLGNVLTYVDNDVTNGQIYYYQVSAVNSLGEGLRSDEVAVTPATIPSVPQNLVAAPGDSEATLTWSAPSSDGGDPIAAYRIYRGTVAGGETYLTELGNVLTYVDQGLTNGQTYYYKVRAVNSVGEGPLSSEASVMPATTPSAPQNLQVTAGSSQNVLIWGPPASDGGRAITGYKVYRGLTSGSEVIWKTLADVLTYVDTGLTNGQVYYYRVSAVNAVGEGALSNEASATPVERTTPSPPQNLEAAAGDTEVVLTWSAPASDGGVPITTFRIYRGVSPGGEVFLTAVGNVLTFVDTSVSNGQIYYYQVSAENSIGEGPRSSEVSATPATLPSAPQSLQSEAGDSYVLLTWIAPADDGGSEITAYTVYRGNASSPFAVLVTLGNVLAYNDTSVLNGVTYYYKVGASNSLGPGPNSSQISATPQVGVVYTIPSAPLGLQAEGGDGQVTLGWSAPADNGGKTITNYTIYRGTTSGTETYLVTVGNLLTYIDLDVTNGVTYYYKVGAVNGVGPGPLSDEASSTPSAPAAPSAPQNLVLDAGDAYVLLSWSPPSDDGGSPLTGYKVYRGTNSSSLSLLVTVSTVLVYNDTSVVNGQVYYYQIAAINAVGEGDLSPLESATPSGGEEVGDDLLILGAVGVLIVVVIIIGIYLWMRRRK